MIYNNIINHLKKNKYNKSFKQSKVITKQLKTIPNQNIIVIKQVTIEHSKYFL